MSDEQKKEVPEKFKALVEQIEKLSVLDLAELVKVLEEKFGVSAAAPVAAAVAVAAAPAEEEKSSFNVELTEAGANKIAVIKVVREVTGLGLADAKGLVDGAPKMIKEGVDKVTAESIQKKVTEAGGKVALK